jgi:hypothetical protein
MNNISVVQAMNNVIALQARAAQTSTAVADDAPRAHPSPTSTSSEGLMQLVATVALHEAASREAGGIKGDRADMKTGVANITKK